MIDFLMEICIFLLFYIIIDIFYYLSGLEFRWSLLNNKYMYCGLPESESTDIENWTNTRLFSEAQNC